MDRVTKFTIQPRYEGRRAGGPAALIADNAAILAALPWRPQYDDLDTSFATRSLGSAILK